MTFLVHRVALLLFVATFISGCATVPADAGNDPRDPLESFNRQVFEFNDGFDRVFLKPVAQAYEYLPEPVRDCLSNIFSNFREPSNAVNNLLQGKPIDAASDTCRFVVNSTIGLAGCFDPARQMGLAKHNEDAGQTMGVWGIGPGPYIVFPILGPSTVRDGIGFFAVEAYLDPNFYMRNVPLRNSIAGVRIVNARAELLPTDDLISGAALDKYTFIRDGYLQRRQNLIHDGSPPSSDAEGQSSTGSPPTVDPNVKKEPAPAAPSSPAPAPAAK